MIVTLVDCRTCGLRHGDAQMCDAERYTVTTATEEIATSPTLEGARLACCVAFEEGQVSGLDRLRIIERRGSSDVIVEGATVTADLHVAFVPRAA